jgi:hypothetical protein
LPVKPRPRRERRHKRRPQRHKVNDILAAGDVRRIGRHAAMAGATSKNR